MHDHTGDRDWDRFYRGEGDNAPHWSGGPNGTMVQEVSDLAPGTALDVGCGEGADAIWLARRAWRVTALDPSRVALDRAATAARAAGVDVTWVHAGLLEVPSGLGTYDLVSVQYPVLRHSDDDAITTLLGAVASGGTLLFVHHEVDPSHAIEHGVGVPGYVMPADVAAHLDDGWAIEVNGARRRPDPLPPDTPHVRDLVLRARRLPMGPT